MSTDEQLKQQFYQQIAPRFDQICITENDEHQRALGFIESQVRYRGWSLGLDVGAGTGRGAAHFARHAPEVDVLCAEPQRPMLLQARSKGLAEGRLLNCNGKQLPLQDQSVDFSTCFGILHHDREPGQIVREMMRVSRHAVFISDGNRFGQGSTWARRIKVWLWRTGLWPAFDRIKTGGRGYTFSPHDGYIYSFSVYDVLQLADGWAQSAFLIPVSPQRGSALDHPLRACSHLLLCLYRDPLPVP